MSAIAMPIMQIRDAIKKIHFDAIEESVPKAVLVRIINCMEDVSDIRLESSISYPLPYILVLAFLAVLSGADTWVDMACFADAYKKKLNGVIPKYKAYGIPSHDTFRRVLGLLKPEELQGATAEFLLEEISELKKALHIADKGKRHLILDGKEQKGTGRKYGTDEKVRNLQTLHCYDASNGICLA